MLVTRMPRDSRIAAREAAAMPFPREETTPPVTNTYFVIDPRRVGMEEFTYKPPASQMSRHRDVRLACAGQRTQDSVHKKYIAAHEGALVVSGPVSASPGGARRRHLTLLFSDLCGSTHLSEAMENEE